MKTTFVKLNDDWNAEPNAPDPKIEIVGSDILLSFYVNPFQFPRFEEEDIGVIRFKNFVRYRLGPENDEGWYRGQCRFSKLAPAWGEFYEVSGDLKLSECPSDWITVLSDTKGTRHFLFYFRDNMFECDAQEWQFEPTANRVRAGISPALPTPPSMRVRTRRLKQGNENAPTGL
jgi:hypothetical protein